MEFAILAPLFFMIVLAMFSGGLAFSRKIAITDAVREGVRYGATLQTTGAISPTCAGGTSADPPPPCWFDMVATRAIGSAGSELAETWDGQYVCIAYVGLAPNGAGPVTRNRERFGTNAATYNTGSMCFDDGRGTSERRVQVVARRNSTFQALLFSSELQLQSEGVARFEAISP